ncbi:hypothetical protein MMAG44476_18007 [Mycolicibacterium mageritense DSM 44476 = CIP 104973]|uniref:Intersectin-EH binding protein Ibp1 n=1 Tax=Mycolicibacterium mageritense TaxID=53462 RepID=A0AAI8TQ85_MYCME|nr:hypothetical protein [Mycolicibacterium mageritense]MBN3455381.1 hypothetical protein [Mycobacterium sp. DSM 3803]OKH65330.1 hypothetical protein EB73_21980 [Mycobacterium sp. SWH-M3]MCC9180147.1 hypothetical protein [Mycolicibacterium mageritense]TXI52089.1 MAG: hypothetical protein E6Q55_37555 [Mycolicibacterium mageritense]CDO23759.1 hypothetical protein BN978_04248 [Mycolicibacterium mageritense DSM 44476 = CIP 104973]
MKIRLTTLAGCLIAGGAAAAIGMAPLASAEPPANPLLPKCEVTGGSSIEGGQTTDCASEGNVQIDATPPEPGYGMFPWDDEFFVL